MNWHSETMSLPNDSNDFSAYDVYISNYDDFSGIAIDFFYFFIDAQHQFTW